MTGKEVTRVAVDRETLRLAVKRTGIQNPVELVEFALRLLVAADPSASFAQAMRGHLPGLDLDV